jgi:hypothetical protein
MCATVRAGWPTVWPTTKQLPPTVVDAVGEQRLYAHHGALPPTYLSTAEKCSVVISLAPSAR